MPPEEAAALPHPGNPNGRRFWRKAPRSRRWRRALTAMGHSVAMPSVEKSGLHIIERVKNGYIGAAIQDATAWRWRLKLNLPLVGR